MADAVARTVIDARDRRARKSGGLLAGQASGEIVGSRQRLGEQTECMQRKPVAIRMRIDRAQGFNRVIDGPHCGGATAIPACTPLCGSRMTARAPMSGPMKECFWRKRSSVTPARFENSAPESVVGTTAWRTGEGRISLGGFNAVPQADLHYFAGVDRLPPPTVRMRSGDASRTARAASIPLACGLCWTQPSNSPT